MEKAQAEKDVAESVVRMKVSRNPKRIVQRKIIGNGSVDNRTQAANHPAGNSDKEKQVGKRPFNRIAIYGHPNTEYGNAGSRQTGKVGGHLANDLKSGGLDKIHV